MNMKKHKKVIVVEKTPSGSYNPDRPISDLVRNQILHLSVAERSLEKRHQSPIDVHSIKTERQASEYIHHLTKKLHARAAESTPSKKAKARPKKSLRKSRKARGKR
jgi:hypothetical protein